MTKAEKSIYSKINRKLKPNGQILKASRGERQQVDLGRFYVVSDKNVIVEHHVNLEALWEVLGPLSPVIKERLDKVLGIA